MEEIQTDEIDILEWRRNAPSDDWIKEVIDNIDWVLREPTSFGTARLFRARAGKQEIGYAVVVASQIDAELHLVKRRYEWYSRRVGDQLWYRIIKDIGVATFTARGDSDDGRKALKRWGFVYDNETHYWTWRRE